MFNEITALGYGLVVFAIIVGVGTIVLFNFGGATGCQSINTSMAWNQTAGKCYSISDPNNSGITPVGAAYTNTNYLVGQLGPSGLAGWTPAIIAISVGLLFLGAFMVNSGGKKKY